MDEMEYPGIRLHLNSICGEMMTPIKIDISTGDIITPNAISYKYPLLMEEKSIKILSYNLETLLAEKLQTILARDEVNTRMRDFYDVYMLYEIYNNRIDFEILLRAFIATNSKRGTVYLIDNWKITMDRILNSSILKKLWTNYQNKYHFAINVLYDEVVKSIMNIFILMHENN